MTAQKYFFTGLPDADGAMTKIHEVTYAAWNLTKKATPSKSELSSKNQRGARGPSFRVPIAQEAITLEMINTPNVVRFLSEKHRVAMIKELEAGAKKSGKEKVSEPLFQDNEGKDGAK